MQHVALQQHTLDTHSKGRPSQPVNPQTGNHYKCGASGCARSFTQYVALQQHTLDTHSKGRPSQPVNPQTGNHYKCGVSGCARSFTQHVALQQHTLDTHSKGRPSQPVNPQTGDGCRPYVAQGQLAIDRIGHIYNGSVFKCGVPGCDRAFKMHDELRQHGLAFHPERRSSAPAARSTHSHASTSSSLTLVNSSIEDNYKPALDRQHSPPQFVAKFSPAGGSGFPQASPIIDSPTGDGGIRVPQLHRVPVAPTFDGGGQSQVDPSHPTPHIGPQFHLHMNRPQSGSAPGGTGPQTQQTPVADSDKQSKSETKKLDHDQVPLGTISLRRPHSPSNTIAGPAAPIVPVDAGIKSRTHDR